MHLLALPSAGGSAGPYRRWQSLLPEWVQVVPVEFPGRATRFHEPFAQGFDDLVSRICDDHAAALVGRHALFGHSMGALVAYAVATRRNRGSAPLPSALFVSASPAPAHVNAARFADRRDDAALIADLRKQDGTPEGVFADAELLALTLDTLRADYRLYGSFVYAADDPLPVPLYAFAGSRDRISRRAIEGWRAETSDAFRTQWFDGGHFFLHDAEHERRMLACMVETLASARVAQTSVDA